MEDLGPVTGLGRFPREGKGYPLQYSSLENSMGCIVFGHDFHFTLPHFIHTYTYTHTHTHTHTSFFRFFSIIEYYKILN